MRRRSKIPETQLQMVRKIRKRERRARKTIWWIIYNWAMTFENKEDARHIADSAVSAML